MTDMVSPQRKNPQIVEKIEILGAETQNIGISQDVRRSVRDPSITQLEKADFKHLIEKIVTDNAETVVLKLKNHVLSDINSAVLDSVFDSLLNNSVCQALYVQNFSRAFGNDQLTKLLTLLKAKPIWCLNIGENYEISNKAWSQFCEALPLTSVTHLYVSEHVISIELKNKMRGYIRENRKKHNNHCSMKNLNVIQRCTNMWWNPINGVKELKPPAPVMDIAAPMIYVPVELTPAHTAYWQEGVGVGGDVKWKFNCTCGETCSSYENYRFHPIGRMYECSKCSIWSHVSCVLGEGVTSDDLEEMTDVMCNGCHSRTRRELKSSDPEAYYLLEKALQLFKKSYNEAHGSKALRLKPSDYLPVRAARTPTKGSKTKKVKKNKQKEAEEREDGDWKFSCKCGEVCSWYENVLYHPAGKWYECTMCHVWSHVLCMYGERQTDADMEKINDALCYSCRSKSRRSRSRTEIETAPVKVSDDSKISELLLAAEEASNSEIQATTKQKSEVLSERKVEKKSEMKNIVG